MIRRAVAAFLIWTDRHQGATLAIAGGLSLLVFALEEVPL